MKVVITSYGKDLTSKTDKSFGRAKWFVLVDTETGAFEAHSNEQNFNAAQGAGIQAAQNVSNLGAEAILTGNVGPNAFRTLSAASIKIFNYQGRCYGSAGPFRMEGRQTSGDKRIDD